VETLIISEKSDNFDQEYIATVLRESYIGKKGYTIPKSVLSKEDLAFLYKDLFLKPETFNPIVKTPEDESFPVYRESINKIYIPSFYGIKRYGLPTKSEISDGETISVPFEKDLRDYQDKIIGVYMDHLSGASDSVVSSIGGGGILEVPCGRGKTVMALKIISLLQKKTLIIVHKEFLMNQWIERISEFLPSAKVGKIQGPIFDIEGKDIVIGMLQTLYDREFQSSDDQAFQSFGLTIIDEVHRIGSQQFSKALIRINTAYMLGISATVERKDGLTKLLYMFIGEKIYTEERDDKDPVCVRAINYSSLDPEFNELVQDYRGNTQYSSMITKLCAFGPRSDFIVRVLMDLFLEKEERPQIMLLAHNRSLLTYLHEKILHCNFATVGFYVGGMKEKALKDTESKEIVLATYAMAAEALDIKSLSILVMATPKTDIIQSVGRILRIRHDNPVIVDIVDQHNIFQNQWRQRNTFYKKCNYCVRSITNQKYAGMKLNWKTDYTWKRVYQSKMEQPSEYKCLIDIDC
jgi:superfamily II DNA or RNA helicase